MYEKQKINNMGKIIHLCRTAMPKFDVELAKTAMQAKEKPRYIHHVNDGKVVTFPLNFESIAPRKIIKTRKFSKDKTRPNNARIASSKGTSKKRGRNR